MATIVPLLILYTFASSATIVTAAQSCAPWSKIGGAGFEPIYPEKDYTPLCLKTPDAQANSSFFSFKPLFPSKVRAVYGIDNLNSEEILDAQTEETLYSSWTKPVQNAGIWFEYDKIDEDGAKESITEFNVGMFKLKGATAGGGAGCDGILSKICSESILESLRWSLFGAMELKGRKPTRPVYFDNALENMTSNQDTLSCRSDFENLSDGSWQYQSKLSPFDHFRATRPIY